jgi:hypothetical protein
MQSDSTENCSAFSYKTCAENVLIQVDYRFDSLRGGA